MFRIYLLVESFWDTLYVLNKHYNLTGDYIKNFQQQSIWHY